MSGLANLARLLEQATPQPLTGAPYNGTVVDTYAQAELFAAAPQMADLLVGLDEHLDKCGCIPRTEAVCVGCRVRARLADFDRRLT